MFFEVPGSALASVSAAAFMLLCAASAVAVAGAFGTVVVCALPFELADGGFTRMSVFVTLIVSAGVFTLVDFYFHFAGLQPAFEEAQQQAAAAGGHFASKAQATPLVDVGDPPLASSFHFYAELSKCNDHGANACDYAVVRDCAVCVLWAQLKGDSLPALLNTLGVEVDDHPAISEDDAIALKRRPLSTCW